MDFVHVALDSVWPAELRTDRLLLRPVTAEDADLVSELLTDERVRTYLGGPASLERVAARQAAYPAAGGAWAVVQPPPSATIAVTVCAIRGCFSRLVST